MEENFATLLETVADDAADRVAVVHGDRRLTSRELDERAARMAGFLAGRGVGAGDRVGIALFNGPEYIETLFGAMKLRAVPVNVNYRYRAKELAQILGDSRAVALVADASLMAEVAGADAPGLHTVVRVGAGSPGPAVDYEEALDRAPMPRIERSGDDEWLLFTGGTTGRPKGVVISHRTLTDTAIPNGYAVLGVPPPQDLAELRASTRRLMDRPDRLVTVIAAPLMHGTGIYTTIGVLLAAGTVIYLTSGSYDPAELARTAERHRATAVCLVGDVFARPLAAELERAARAGRPYDLSALNRMVSVGVTWSPEVKERLLQHCDARLEDVIAATEGGGFARSVTSRSSGTITSTFELMPGARVVDENGRDVEPGSGEVGELAAPAPEDVHYLDDPVKTAATFRVIDGRRYVVPGDLATLRADGSLVLLGRGNRVINTGGEKVHAEEVEQVIAARPGVRDVTVVGLPDERWGHRIVAVVAVEPDSRLDDDAIRDAVGDELAGYKKPRDVVFVPEVRRSPSGKADLSWAQEVAEGIRR